MLNRHWVLILSGIYSTNTTPPRFYFYGFLCARKNHSYCPSTWMIQRVNMKKGAAGAVWVGFCPIFFFFPASKASFPLRANGVFSSKEFTLQGFPNSCGLKSLFTCSTLEISVIFNERTYMMNLIKGKWTVMRSGKKNPGISLYPFLWGTFSLK